MHRQRSSNTGTAGHVGAGGLKESADLEIDLLLPAAISRRIRIDHGRTSLRHHLSHRGRLVSIIGSNRLYQHQPTAICPVDSAITVHAIAHHHQRTDIAIIAAGVVREVVGNARHIRDAHRSDRRVVTRHGRRCRL